MARAINAKETSQSRDQNQRQTASNVMRFTSQLDSLTKQKQRAHPLTDIYEALSTKHPLHSGPGCSKGG